VGPDQLRWWFDDYLEAANRHDLEAVRELLAPDVRRQGLPRGADAWLEDAAALLAAFPDVQWKRIRVVVEEDRIAAHLRARGTHRGPFLGVPATGRHVNWAEFGFFRIAGGRATEYAGALDGAGLLEQLRG
jgi:predicted ester cyclase